MVRNFSNEKCKYQEIAKSKLEVNFFKKNNLPEMFYKNGCYAKRFSVLSLFCSSDQNNSCKVVYF